MPRDRSAPSSCNTTLFGVADDGRLVGVSDVRTISLRVLAAARNVTPRLDEVIRVEQLTIEAQQIVLAQVPADLADTYLAGTSYRIRQGAQNVLMSVQAIVEHAHSRGLRPFDRSAVPGTSLDDLDVQQVGAFLQRRVGEQLDPAAPAAAPLLHNLHILGDASCSDCATVAGILMFGRDPQRHLPQSVLQCARFQGTTVARFIDRVEIGGPIPSQLSAGMDFVRRNIRHGTVIEGLEHVDVDEYPLTAIREALTNALCHRDYYHPGAVVNLSIFDDRIEVLNPGGLLPGLQVETLEGAHKLRNPALGQLMHDTRLIERWGSGILRMRLAMQTAGLAAPEIRGSRDWFHLIFWGPGESFLSVDRPLATPRSSADSPAATGEPVPPIALPQLNQRQRRLLQELPVRGSISREEYEQEFGVPERTANRDLGQLVALGLLLRVGKTHGLRYILNRTGDSE